MYYSVREGLKPDRNKRDLRGRPRIQSVLMKGREFKLSPNKSRKGLMTSREIKDLGGRFKTETKRLGDIFAVAQESNPSSWKEGEFKLSPNKSRKRLMTSREIKDLGSRGKPD
ncbi:hypothetical protein CEXT_37811 [Caerostris extrusa]|uniref:Uncharacterized protein n=1 Tax=Caerostris extrusa TaxID=172846 RepID=A0AAV4XDG5_CAEEX|nr:hypothetical protein CEXT_37811 [Caerostris extrusa]